MHGFELLREETIPEYNSVAKIFRHRQTGAQLVSIENDDENKVFSVTLKTLPPDSTGVAHILEHSVLGGSRKYPVKEPFLELIKGSMQTFVNAMTFPDKTMYPVASTNTQDFYNLVDVYLDAVFYPLIQERTLAQEGWHYELDSPDSPLVYRGVVYNEMKGVYSSPDSLVEQYAQMSLFPETVYGVDSGGDPREIPNLTYEQFKSFYERYYHPSNALFWFYGDDDTEDRLRIVNEFIGDVEPLDNPPDTTIAVQEPFDVPDYWEKPYSVAADEAEQATHYVTVNWVLDAPLEPVTYLATQVLARLLIGTPAAPLRKALIDSGLGEDLAGEGLVTWLRQMIFSTGLKGVAADDVDKIELLIFETLQDLVDDGLSDDLIEAALNSIEFRLREANFGNFPRGLALHILALNSWLYGGDPLDHLKFEEPLQTLKDALADNPHYFEDMIARLLLDNTHRTTLILKPDPELSQRLDAEERARLDEARAALDEDDLQTIIQETAALKAWQNTPDDPADLARIPRLTLDDLDPENTPIPTDLLRVQGAQMLYHDLFTNGILYLDLGFDLHTLPEELLPYTALFGRALLEMGTQAQDFVALSNRIDRETGGITSTTLINDVINSEAETAWLVLRGKAIANQTDKLLDILHDVLLDVQLDNPQRFLQIVLEEKAGLEASLIPGGHMVSLRRLGSHFSRAGWLDEQTGGLSYLFFLRELAERVRDDWPSVLTDLEAVRAALITRQGALLNATLDEETFAAVQPQLNNFLSTLPDHTAERQTWDAALPAGHEGLTIPAQVNYVAKGANLYDQGYTLHGSVSVISRHLSLTHLWEQIRMVGGAYGAFNRFDPASGTFAFGSYRDPNLLNTLKVYDEAADFLRQVDIDEGGLAAAIIGAISDMDRYQLPDAKGYTALKRYLTHYTDELRQKHRTEVLNTTVEDFRRFADVIQNVAEAGQVVVLGSAEAIAEANQAQGDGWLAVTRVL